MAMGHMMLHGARLRSDAYGAKALPSRRMADQALGKTASQCYRRRSGQQDGSNRVAFRAKARTITNLTLCRGLNRDTEEAAKTTGLEVAQRFLFPLLGRRRIKASPKSLRDKSMCELKHFRIDRNREVTRSSSREHSHQASEWEQ